MSQMDLRTEVATNTPSQLWTAKELLGYPVRANDGDTGKLHDGYFDQQSWSIRYFVVDIGDWVLDTGRWIPGRKVIISRLAFRQPGRAVRLLFLTLLKEQVNRSPVADLERLNAYEATIRQLETPPLSPERLGADLSSVDKPKMFPTPSDKMVQAPLSGNRTNGAKKMTKGSPPLSSIKAILGYHLQALDGGIGHVEDVLIDPETWMIHFVVIDTRNWLPGKKVIVAPSQIDLITSTDSTVDVVYIDLPRETIENCPEFDHSTLRRPMLVG
jgi:uncharacterized protein YrrD